MSKNVKKASLLTNRQNSRFGGLIAVLGGREPYDWILNDLLDNELVERVNDKLFITIKGNNEKNRLATLAGLMVEKEVAKTLNNIKY